MTENQTWLKQVMNLGIFLMLGISLGANAGDTWKEEVLLHDGQKVVAERFVQRGGRHEIGQTGTYVEQTLKFSLPGSAQTIEWTDSRDPDLGSANFLPMLLDIAEGTPYLVAYPMGCLSYNKWGRPNPPYVVFKYQANAWERIPLQSLPSEIKTPNLIFSEPDVEIGRIGKRFVSAEMIKQMVDETRQPEYKSVLREPMSMGIGATSCEVLIHYKCGWGSPSEVNRIYFENSCK